MAGPESAPSQPQQVHDIDDFAGGGSTHRGVMFDNDASGPNADMSQIFDFNGENGYPDGAAHGMEAQEFSTEDASASAETSAEVNTVTFGQNKFNPNGYTVGEDEFFGFNGEHGYSDSPASAEALQDHTPESAVNIEDANNVPTNDVETQSRNVSFVRETTTDKDGNKVTKVVSAEGQEMVDSTTKTGHKHTASEQTQKEAQPDEISEQSEPGKEVVKYEAPETEQSEPGKEVVKYEAPEAAPEPTEPGKEVATRSLNPDNIELSDFGLSEKQAQLLAVSVESYVDLLARSARKTVRGRRHSVAQVSAAREAVDQHFDTSFGAALTGIAAREGWTPEQTEQVEARLRSNLKVSTLGRLQKRRIELEEKKSPLHQKFLDFWARQGGGEHWYSWKRIKGNAKRGLMLSPLAIPGIAYGINAAREAHESGIPLSTVLTAGALAAAATGISRGLAVAKINKDVSGTTVAGLQHDQMLGNMENSGRLDLQEIDEGVGDIVRGNKLRAAKAGLVGGGLAVAGFFGAKGIGHFIDTGGAVPPVDGAPEAPVNDNLSPTDNNTIDQLPTPEQSAGVPTDVEAGSGIIRETDQLGIGDREIATQAYAYAVNKVGVDNVFESGTTKLFDFGNTTHGAPNMGINEPGGMTFKGEYFDAVNEYLTSVGRPPVSR